MHKPVSTASVAVLLAATALAGIMPAMAAAPRVSFDKQNQYIASFCGKYRGADQCNEWRSDHVNWTSEQYKIFYRRHQNDKEFANPEAASLFGAGLDAASSGHAD